MKINKQTNKFICAYVCVYRDRYMYTNAYARI